MNRTGFDGVIFDLDGTLLDTIADIGNAANSVLRQHRFREGKKSCYGAEHGSWLNLRAMC